MFLFFQKQNFKGYFFISLTRYSRKKLCAYCLNVQKLYLEAKIKISEGTLFIPVLKVEENKVPSEK